jgi:hypothetical protein
LFMSKRLSRRLLILAALASVLPAMAQLPAIRLLPDAPREDLRAYLEVDVPPCRIRSVDVAAPHPSTRLVTIATGTCVQDSMDVGKYVVQLGPLLRGPALVEAIIDASSQTLSFEVGAAITPPISGASVDSNMFLGPDARADRALYLMYACGRTGSATVNDSRTEVVVELSYAPVVCVPEPPVFTSVRLGFPRAGQHVVIARRDGVIVGTQYLVVEKGLDKLDYSDLWWVEEESGWGLVIKQHDKDRLIAVLYGYGANGRPRWWAMSGGDWNTATQVVGEMTDARGTPQTGPYDVSRLRQQVVLTAFLDFKSADTALLTIFSSGVPPVELGLPQRKSWTIKRQAF